MSQRVVCLSGGQQLIIRKRDGWWIVEDAETRECLSGGFATAAQAEAAARQTEPCTDPAWSTSVEVGRADCGYRHASG